MVFPVCKTRQNGWGINTTAFPPLRMFSSTSILTFMNQTTEGEFMLVRHHANSANPHSQPFYTKYASTLQRTLAR